MSESRYLRSESLAEVGIKGQKKLRDSSVLIVGLGGIGSITAPYLALSGVGKCALLDFDSIDLTNLHRQIIYRENLVSKSKLESCLDYIRLRNSEVELVGYEIKLNSETDFSFLKDYDLVLDGTDNLETRYILHRVCRAYSVPYLFSSAIGFEAMLTFFLHQEDMPCLECLFPFSSKDDFPCSCSESGVLGPVPGFIACYQAVEAIKYLLNTGNIFSSELYRVNLLTNNFSVSKILRDKACKCCSLDSAQSLLKSIKIFSNSNNMNIISSKQLKLRLDKGVRDFKLIDVREPFEFDQNRIENAVNFPLSQLLSKVQSEGISREEEIVVYCKSGKRSEKAQRDLLDAGFSKVSNLEGGIEAFFK